MHIYIYLYDIWYINISMVHFFIFFFIKRKRAMEIGGRILFNDLQFAAYGQLVLVSSEVPL